MWQSPRELEKVKRFGCAIETSPREVKKVKKFGCGIETIDHNSFLGCPGAVILASKLPLGGGRTLRYLALGT